MKRKRPNLLLAVCTNRNPPQAPKGPSFVRLHHEKNHSSRADYPPSESSGAASEVEESHLRLAVVVVVLGGQTRPWEEEEVVVAELGGRARPWTEAVAEEGAGEVLRGERTWAWLKGVFTLETT